MTCARCHQPICPCPDAVYSGVVAVDTATEAGGRARHIRDTACMAGAARQTDADSRAPVAIQTRGLA